jgi:hypothetical protein
VKVALVGRELLFGSRIASLVEDAGAELTRVDEPQSLPPAASVQLVLVDWAERQPGWADALSSWAAEAEGSRPHVLLFGPHTDLRAHADARAAGLGPMVARSKLLLTLRDALGKGTMRSG